MAMEQEIMRKPFKHDEASMTITIRCNKNGQDPIISIGATGKKKDKTPATVTENATIPEPGHEDYPGPLLDLNKEITAEDVGKRAIVVTNPCVWINIAGMVFRVCW